MAELDLHLLCVSSQCGDPVRLTVGLNPITS